MLIRDINSSWLTPKIKAYLKKITSEGVEPKVGYKRLRSDNSMLFFEWYIWIHNSSLCYFNNNWAYQYLFNWDRIEWVDFSNEWDLYIEWVIENWKITQAVIDIELEREKIDASFLSWYHSWRHRDYSNGSSIRVWLEIERAEYIYKDEFDILLKNNWRVERDGSVAWWEYITPILDIDKAYDFIKECSFVLKNKVSGACWWHIHLSVKWVESDTLYRRLNNYRPILWALYPRRAINSYCHKNWSWRYRDILITDYWTVEFRIFPQLRSLTQTKFRLALVKFFASNPIASRDEAIAKIWWIEFLSILDIVYKTTDRKIEILSRILRAYEIDENEISDVMNFAKVEIEKLRKNK